jgi:hypothetical protein
MKNCVHNLWKICVIQFSQCDIFNHASAVLNVVGLL